MWSRSTWATVAMLSADNGENVSFTCWILGSKIGIGVYPLSPATLSGSERTVHLKPVMRSILYVLVVVGIFACGGAWLANQKFDNDVQARARAAQAAAPEYVKNLERSESARKGCVH